ncbi:hypothetical protein PHMEG_00039595 [Phytophthora megakarya]|uniref:Retrotransposon gag domain-containing protein n=1 Tax=Phytophthora megakarya TaxID=4795 RepID=A0A225UGM1_9STRA|nr:hypothetical protein PHMEG_00039595 [Phytophthora megakarya]
MEEIKANQALLHEVINKVQSFALRSDEEMTNQKAELTALRGELDSLRQNSQNQGQGVSGNGVTPGTEWDVVGQIPPHAPAFTALEFENRISTCLKQKETPMYDGTNDDDIDVYPLVYLGQEQVDWRVGELMLNHIKGKAKKWLLQDYRGERRWSHIVKKMKQRFVTRSREEDLVASFFDCSQGNRSLDIYIDEFQRLCCTDDVSEKYKVIMFKKGLRSNQPRELLKIQTYETLEELVDAARSFNPRDTVSEMPKTGGNKGPSSNPKTPVTTKPKSTESGKCSSVRCFEKGHTEDKY